MEEFLEGLRTFECPPPDPSEFITQSEQWYKQLGVDAPVKGRFWITNGTKSRVISGDIPDGWWKGRVKMSDETRAKMSASHTGKSKPWVSKSRKGKKLSEETKSKIKRNHKPITGMKFKSPATSLSNMGRKWWNNGEIQTFCKECPEGFTAGMLKRLQ